MSTYSNRLYDHFLRERSTFGRSVLAVVSISIFFALVFQPYLATLEGLVDLERELTMQAESIATVQDQISKATNGIERATEYMGDASTYQALYEDTDRWVADLDGMEQLYDRRSRTVESLRSTLDIEDQSAWQTGSVPSVRIIAKLREKRPDIMESYVQGDDCFFRIEADWVRCFINGKLSPIRTRLARVLYDRTDSHEYTNELKVPLNANRKEYDEGFEAALNTTGHAEWVRGYLDKEKAIIRQWYVWMAEERLKQMREASQQQALLTQNQQRRSRLEERKKEIRRSGKLDTAVGSLPLAFLDLLTLLPLILLITTIMLLRSQSRLLELRQKYQCNAQDEEASAEALRLTMPMWLDPLRGRFVGWWVLALILLPGIAALIGLEQIASNRGLSIGSVQLKYTLAGTLIAAVIFAMQYVKLCKVWIRASKV